MPRKTPRIKTLQMMQIISKASGCMIPIGEMKFSHVDMRTNEHVYKILMPITKEWQEIRIDKRFVVARCLPDSIIKLIDYYTELKRLMESARDLQVFNEDVRPICDQERKIFGVRVGFLNKCFPLPTITKASSSSIQMAWYKKLNNDLF